MTGKHSYTAIIYEGFPGPGGEQDFMISQILCRPVPCFLVDLPFTPSELPGTRVIFWREGQPWIKTAMMIDMRSNRTPTCYIAVRRVGSIDAERRWSEETRSDLCEIGNPGWN